MMQKFRSLPVNIYAVQYDGDNGQAIAKMVNDTNPHPDSLARETKNMVDGEPKMQLIIPTLEGEMAASMGDWIIKGTLGEYYPCKPAVFTKKYLAVD